MFKNKYEAIYAIANREKKQFNMKYILFEGLKIYKLDSLLRFLNGRRYVTSILIDFFYNILLRYIKLYSIYVYVFI